MSEKRFTYDKPLVAFSKGGINDNVTGETYEFTMDTVLDLLNELQEENEQLRILLKEAEEEIDRLKKSNQGFMESLVNKGSEKEDNQETEVRECQFCGEFRTEYHEYDDYSWSAEDYCNAGHDLEDTNPNSCKDYWDND